MGKIGKFFKGLGVFFRIVDEQACLSLTNVAVYLVLVKIALAQDFSLVDAGMILISLLNYSGKKLINKIPEKPKEIPLEVRTQKELKDLREKLSAISASIGLTRRKL